MEKEEHTVGSTKYVPFPEPYCRVVLSALLEKSNMTVWCHHCFLLAERMINFGLAKRRGRVEGKSLAFRWTLTLVFLSIGFWTFLLSAAHRKIRQLDYELTNYAKYNYNCFAL